ncbi:MAG: OmpH family outer membrane protein [Phycisphaeraceae bacterium]|nr:OmpH family outer membrane protein [Phycisphaeraceae bacterium]
MQNNRFSSLLAVMVMIALAAILTGPLSGSNQASGNRGGVAVLDLNRTYQDLRERTQLEQEIQAIVNRFNEERAERARAIERIEQSMGILPPEGEEFAKLRADRQRKQVEFRLWQQYQERRVVRESLLKREQLYRKAISTAGELASRAGYDVVLLKDPTTAFPPNINPQQFQAIADSRKLLWSRSEVDLTREVVERMNATYGR